MQKEFEYTEIAPIIEDKVRFIKKIRLAAILILFAQGGSIVSLLQAMLSDSPRTGFIEVIIISGCAILLLMLLFVRIVNTNDSLRIFLDENLIIQSLHRRAEPAEPGPSSADAPLAENVPNTDFTLHTLAAYMQEGMAVLREGKVLYVNSNLAYLVGAMPEELTGFGIDGFVHPDDMPMLNLNENEAPESITAPSRATLRLTTRLGDQRWVICSTHRIVWQDSKATLLLFENIGALKQAQRSLEEHEQQSRILIERTPLGIAMFDAIGQLKVANTTWYSLWSNIAGVGARRFNILQDPFLPREDIDKAIRQAYNGHESGISALEHPAPWGETRWLNMNFHPLQNAVGQVIGMVMIQQDITDHVRSSRRENELNEQLATMRVEYVHKQEKMGMIIDAMPSVILYVDNNDTIIMLNRMAELRLDLPRQRLVGQNLQQLKGQLAPYFEFIEKSRREHKLVQAGRVPRITARGLVYEDIIVYPIDYKKQPGAILRIDDVTERMQAELAFSYLNELTEFSGLLDDCLGNSLEETEALRAGLKQLESNLAAYRPAQENALPALEPENLHGIVDACLTRLANMADVTKEYSSVLPKVLCEKTELGNSLNAMLDACLGLHAFEARREKTYSLPRFTIKTSRFGAWMRLAISCNGPKLQAEETLKVFAPLALREYGYNNFALTQAFFCINRLHQGKLQCLPLPDGGLQFLCDLRYTG